MGYRKIQENYKKIEWTYTGYGKCPVCGKNVRRQITDYQTINPFNKNSNGEVKTAQEIYIELQDHTPEFDFTHDKCRRNNEN